MQLFLCTRYKITPNTYVRTYLCIRTYVDFISGVRCASGVMMYVHSFVFYVCMYGHMIYNKAPCTHGSSSAPRWSLLRYGKNVSCRAGGFREDGRQASKLATVWGGARIYIYSWCSRRGDTNQVPWPSAGPRRVNAWHLIDTLKKTNKPNFLKPHAQCSDAKHPCVCVCDFSRWPLSSFGFHLVPVCYCLFGTNATTGVPYFLFLSPISKAGFIDNGEGAERCAYLCNLDKKKKSKTTLFVVCARIFSGKPGLKFVLGGVLSCLYYGGTFTYIPPIRTRARRSLQSMRNRSLCYLLRRI